jgi:hypothetical protein
VRPVEQAGQSSKFGRLHGRSIGRTTAWQNGRTTRHQDQGAPVVAGLRAPVQPPCALPSRLGRQTEPFADLRVGEPRRDDRRPGCPVVCTLGRWWRTLRLLVVCPVGRSVFRRC